MYHLVKFVFILSVVIPALSENQAGILLDYRNSYLSYEQKGLDICPFTYFRESCADFAHVIVIEPSVNTDNGSSAICLGTIISEQFVLTTASCVPTKHENLKLDAKIAEDIAIDSIYLHPDYKLSPDQGPSLNNLAIIKLNSSLSFNKNVAASCLWDSESLDLYTKVQEIEFDQTVQRLEQNTTICSGTAKNDCLKSALQQWCQRKSSSGILQIRELGKYRMHAMIASFGCDEDKKIVPISHYLPWIREVTKYNQIEYNFTDVGLGEKCFKNDGIGGVCLPTNECPQIQKNFKALWKNNSISTCGFEGDEALTCCATEDMQVGPDTETLFRDIIQEIENCELLYDEFRRTPEEHQLHSQVAIIDIHNSINCTATLISTRYLLTSAQCVLDVDIPHSSVWLGMGDEEETVGQKNNIQAIFLHPKFHPKTSHFNLAVVMLKYPALIQSFSVPACLWREKSKMPTNLEAVSFHSDERIFSVAATTPMYYSDCRRLHDSQLIPSELCVQYKSRSECNSVEQETLCQNPGSGLYSNLYYGEDMKPVTYVVGIFNKGHTCDKRGPAIYTRVSEYYQWIKSVIYLSSQQTK
ncbi:venom prothrombin activator porpharin-D-like [Topomyia yanbarensis]|uniref:venom prothrombin activator porpharin-D-like n=1 Tax=Topomyia yanbarensis TaxID=2498891 RepID=UPI00273B7ECA|nr:venom prothrombin activator porpharin-D-like [Topomyia yanbarensis]